MSVAPHLPSGDHTDSAVNELSRDWSDHAYLRDGNARQREAWRALHALDVVGVLRRHRPVLAGAIPLGLDVEGSDLDVICQADDLPAFTRLVGEAFGHYDGFRSRITEKEGVPSVVARFTYDGFPVEIFAQAAPVERQRAVRHLQVEARLLALGGDAAREGIRGLRAGGLKTEPAFARYFGLPGDPYRTLLALADLTDEALLTVALQAGSEAANARA